MFSKIKLFVTGLAGLMLILISSLLKSNKELQKRVKGQNEQQKKVEQAIKENSKLTEDNIDEALNNHFRY